MARPTLNSLTLLAAALLAGANACSSNAAPTSVPAPGADPTDDAPAATDGGTTNADGSRPLPRATGSAGCAKSGAAAGLRTGLSITAGGRARTYELAVPPAHDGTRAYPLVFVFHSGGRDGASVRDYFGFSAIAGTEAIFVYPDGLNKEWDLDSPTDTNRDVALFDALRAHVAAEYCVDETRVLATGSSMGGYLANQLGCRRGDALRAIAPHSAGGPWESGPNAYDDQGNLKCAQKPPAAMVFHGLRDTSVDPKDGQASVDHWAWANGCSGAQPAPTSPSPCVAYQGCKRPVVSCRIPDGTHRIWDAGPKATWDFFASLN